MIFTACADTVGRMKDMVNGEAGGRVGVGVSNIAIPNMVIVGVYQTWRYWGCTKHGGVGGIPNMVMLGCTLDCSTGCCLGNELWNNCKHSHGTGIDANICSL